MEHEYPQYAGEDVENSAPSIGNLCPVVFSLPQLLLWSTVSTVPWYTVVWESFSWLCSPNWLDHTVLGEMGSIQTLKCWVVGAGNWRDRNNRIVWPDRAGLVSMSKIDPPHYTHYKNVLVVKKGLVIFTYYESGLLKVSASYRVGGLVYHTHDL